MNKTIRIWKQERQVNLKKNKIEMISWPDSTFLMSFHTFFKNFLATVFGCFFDECIRS